MDSAEFKTKIEKNCTNCGEIKLISEFYKDKKTKDGYFSIIDFRGEIIRLFQKHGFHFHAEVTIWKNPELAALRTKNHQLMHGSTKRDSAIVRPGLADYLIVMR
jgi:hypothetical protein